jgi:hypothetical protein
MTNPIKNKKVIIPTIVGLGLFAVVLTAIGPISAIAEPSGNTQMPTIAGSVNVQQAMKDYLADHRTTSFSAAASIAERQVDNGVILSGQSGVVQGYLAYTFFVVDNKGDTGYKVIVDAGNGQVLYKSDGMSLKDMGKFGQKHIGFGPFGGHDFGGRMMKQQIAPQSDTTNPEQQ